MRKEAEQKAAAALKKHPCFAAATNEELLRLVRDERTVLRELAGGQTVFPVRGVPQAFGLLLSGSCLVRRGGRIVRTVPAGGVFGLGSLFAANGEPTESYTAQTDGKAIYFSKAAVEELMQADFAVTRGFLAFLSERIDELDGRATAAGSGSAETKTARFLAEHQKQGSDEVALSPDFDRLARQIGVSRDALSRALDRLTAAGAIGLRGRKLTIKDKERLELFMQGKKDEP